MAHSGLDLPPPRIDAPGLPLIRDAHFFAMWYASAGMAPTHISTTKSTASSQYHHLNSGRNRPERTREVSSHGTSASTRMAPNIASTPKNLASMMPKDSQLTSITTQTSAVKARRIA